jgi:hypothetical protein
MHNVDFRQEERDEMLPQLKENNWKTDLVLLADIKSDYSEKNASFYLNSVEAFRERVLSLSNKSIKINIFYSTEA